MGCGEAWRWESGEAQFLYNRRVVADHVDDIVRGQEPEVNARPDHAFVPTVPFPASSENLTDGRLSAQRPRHLRRAERVRWMEWFGGVCAMRNVR